MAQKAIGPNFFAELKAAGVSLDGLSWLADGTFTFRDDVSAQTRAAVLAVYAAHDPATPSWANYQAGAQALMDASARTMERVQEAISLGNTTADATDVVTFMRYRRSLRAILSASSGDASQPYPTRPAYPAGT